MSYKNHQNKIYYIQVHVSLQPLLYHLVDHQEILLLQIKRWG